MSVRADALDASLNKLLASLVSMTEQPSLSQKGADVAIGTWGTNAVDWEERIDMDRLRRERLARLKAQLEQSSLGAVLAFDFANIRYMTATHIGTWAMDKFIRFAPSNHGL